MERSLSFKVRGRVEAEYEHVNQDTAVTTYPDMSATELRRARLGVEGVVYYDVKYILEVDFANDVVAVKDAYLQYQGVKIGETPLYFRAGNFRTPNSFELLTSELFVDTLERAAFVNCLATRSTGRLPGQLLARPLGIGGRYLRRSFPVGQRACSRCSRASPGMRT